MILILAKKNLYFLLTSYVNSPLACEYTVLLKLMTSSERKGGPYDLNLLPAVYISPVTSPTHHSAQLKPADWLIEAASDHILSKYFIKIP